MALQSYLDELKRLIPQAIDELPPGTLEERLGDAIRAYSRISPYCPRPIDYEGDGETYDFDLPSNWDLEFSRVRSIEYPVGYQEPEYLEPDEYILYYSPTSGWQLRLFSIPASGETLRVLYITLHRLTDSEDTIPERDKRAVCYLAGSLIARNLAAKYAGFTDPSLSADVINYRTKQREYSEVANQFEAQFKLHFGMDARALAPAAGAWGELDFALKTRQGVEPP